MKRLIWPVYASLLACEIGLLLGVAVAQDTTLRYEHSDPRGWCPAEDRMCRSAWLRVQQERLRTDYCKLHQWERSCWTFQHAEEDKR